MEQDFPLSKSPPADCRACPLRGLGLFPPADDESLDQIRLIRAGTRRLKHGEVIYRTGDLSRHAYTLFDGYAVRYQMLPSGKRQVLQFAVTGDFLCNLDSDAHIWPDTAEVVGHAVLCCLSAVGLQKLFDEKIHIAHQIAMIRGAEKRRLESHITDIGQRSAFDGIARFLLHFFEREQVHGRTRGNRCYFPFRQNDVGDALGLSSVHVSRMLSELREAGLMTVDNRWLTIPDLERVARRVEVESGRLHVRPLL